MEARYAAVGALAGVAVISMAFMPVTGWTQQPVGGGADSVQAAVGRITARLDSLEAGQCPAQSPIAVPAASGDARTDSLSAALGRLAARLEAVGAARCAPSAAAAAPGRERHHG